MKYFDLQGRIGVIAHRGGSNLFQENTMTAFRKAEELGVDAIELDVHLSKDGHMMVIHDPDLERIAGDQRLVSEMTFEELRAVRLPGNEHIPELPEVLKEIRIPLVIELKSPRTLNAIVELFSANPEYVGKCVVISFFHSALKSLKEKFPELETGALIAGFPADPVGVAKACGSGTLSFYYEGIEKRYVDLCHSGGIKVSVWTPNSESDIKDMISAGVDSIASDRPDLVLKLLGR